MKSRKQETTYQIISLIIKIKNILPTITAIELDPHTYEVIETYLKEHNTSKISNITIIKAKY